MKGKKIVSSLLVAATLVGCTAADDLGGFSGRTGGTAGGAAAGALIGQLIGKDTKSTLVGAGIGSLVGLTWGAYLDKQEAALKDSLKDTPVQVAREGENLNINLPGGVTFATDSASIASSFYSSLNEIAKVLVQYPESKILVNGYTDSTGGDAHNQALSERRAESVANYLVAQGVSSSRIIATGYGKLDPIATNTTEAGKQANRRVEVKIVPLN
ncbi:MULTISPECIES: OmpA family protein [Fusobacterium]|uniref:OmpA family protein n=1 Tax=Fusobacterium TaxID=848 RepID=UPI0025C52283|nr:OmpA family protein [Fusobacterium sp.]MCI5724625.1 OmpA family protein [Fusobacterium sp.]MDY5305515.1 OmpA family protein [Fusobacterium gastrosuis]